MLKPPWRQVSCRDFKAANTYSVVLDLASQVLRVKAPEAIDLGDGGGSVEAPMLPSFPAPDPHQPFTPAAVLSFKAKQFDDGLYACVEQAADSGLGNAMGKQALVLELLQSLAADNPASALLTTAARLGGAEPVVPGPVSSAADELRRAFLDDELRSKPLGFYTWSEVLARIFRRDRFLQTDLETLPARALAMALSGDEALQLAYFAALRLSERLTNALAWDDLRGAAQAFQQGRATGFERRVSFFPPSRAHETDLMTKLFGAREIPDGFNLADETIRRIRDGRLDLTPTPESGWYDHQTFALAALLAPDRLREGARLELDPTYLRELEGLFKALLALTRETHVKQLEEPAEGAAVPGPEVIVQPRLSLEPLPTYYRRRARSYQFVREVLEEAFGKAGLETMQRLTPEGPVAQPLGVELRQIEGVFNGAHLRSCEEIGLSPEGSPNEDDRAALDSFLKSVVADPDLGCDVRMMVPLFHDVGRQKTKVWVVLGVASKLLGVSYKSFPSVVAVRDAKGKAVRPQVIFDDELHEYPYFATAEVYVTKVLDRTEFRGHCDRFKTSKAILEHLE